jgi:acetylglutamate kinase
MKVPVGFKFSGVHAGLKVSRKDLALVFSEAPCSAAGCFTQNLAKAAPVLDAEARLPASGLHAMLFTSGNANALTGPEGLADVKACREALAGELRVPPGTILTGATGVIGQRLPVQKIVVALPLAVASLKAEIQPAAEAILGTDTRVKMTSRTLQLPGEGGAPREVTISAFCKGAGMVAPELATLLVAICTDAAISPGALAGALRLAVAGSFNALTVDGDTSTNDSVIALANGRAGNTAIDGAGPALASFTESLTSLCTQLAREVAADGDGATRLIEVRVTGAPTVEIARDLARAVAGSTLVKAALFGASPNWGRILSAAGARAGSRGYQVDPAAARVSLQGTVVYDKAPIAFDQMALKARMRDPEIGVDLAFDAGTAHAPAWGCDLSYDAVKIAADQPALSATGGLEGGSGAEKLAAHSPQFKVSLLVEALSYIQKFTGTRCVIKYGGAAMVKESLKASFCKDIILLRSVGLRPIVVHGGGPEITRTLEKLGGKAEFVDGQRVTNPADLKVVEMVLTGSINTDLVTMLNQEDGHAVGLSGKDGALLRARKLQNEGGRDLGQVGEVTRVNKEFLAMLVDQGYVPVISPIGLGEDGQSYNINADAVAAKIAAAVGAQKLIYLSDVAGILQAGELVPELDTKDLERMMADGTISGGMIAKTKSILEALREGVKSVHLIDGRVPHSIIGELFTDRGLGSMVSP